MSSKRKIYRIETYPSIAAVDDAGSSPVATRPVDFNAIMAELKAIRDTMGHHSTPISHEVAPELLNAFKKEIGEAMKLKAELDAMYEAINRTKHEIATLHTTGFKGKEMTRVTGELDAVVNGTAEATDGILTAAEEIDQLCSTLSPYLKDAQQSGIVDDIQSRIILIFEQCNFQDLTGQRIQKVVNTLKFIEERINRMMDIWGGIDSFNDIEVDVIAEKEGDAALLNGPKLATDINHASQDDIDALFS